MNDMVVQALFPEPAAVEARKPIQNSSTRDSSFDEVLEARLEDRERNQIQRQKDPDPAQNAAGGQAEKTAPAEPENKKPEPESCSPTDQAQEAAATTDMVTQAEVLATQLGVLNNPVEGTTELVAAAMETAPSGVGMTDLQGDLPTLVPETLQTESEQSSSENILASNLNTVQKEQVVKGMESEEKQQVKTEVQENRLVGQDLIDSLKKAAEQKTGETSEKGSHVADAFKNLKMENQPQTGQAGSVQLQMGVPASQVSMVIEPARSAEAHQATILTQVENGVNDLLKSKHTSLSIQLHPEELGRIQLKLVQDENGLRVAMHAEKSDTNQLLERHLHSLQKALSDAGIQLSGFDIGARNQDSSRNQDFWKKLSTGIPFQVGTVETPEPGLVPSSYGHSPDTAVDYRI